MTAMVEACVSSLVIHQLVRVVALSSVISMRSSQTSTNGSFPTKNFWLVKLHLKSTRMFLTNEVEGHPSSFIDQF